MYLEFYGLSEKPFSQTPDPRFLYWNDHNRETLASLSYGIRERKGFIAMLGEAGTGKTTLLRKLLDDLGDDIVSVFLFNPNATFEEILEYTLSELGITAPSGRKLAMLQRLNEFLLAAYGEGRNTILLIDEAQDLDSDVLESLRLLSNLETSDDKILQIVLSGQPELAEKLADPSLRQLKQRIAVRCKLEPLQREELPEYLGARLAVAGGSPDLFDPDALPAIWEFSTGIPRIVNTVCDNALLLGYALGKRTIDVSVMQEVITDLRKIDVEEWAPIRTPRAPAAPVEEPATAPYQAPPAPPQPYVAPEQPAFEAPPRPMEYRYAADPRSGGSLGWVVAAALAGLLILLAGAWLNQPGRQVVPGPTAPASLNTTVQPNSMDLSGATVATAATRNPTPPVARTEVVPPTAETVERRVATPPSAVTARPLPAAPESEARGLRTAAPVVDPEPRTVTAPPAETETRVEASASAAKDAPSDRAPAARADAGSAAKQIESLAETSQLAPQTEPLARDERLALSRSTEQTIEAGQPERTAPADTVAVAPGDTLTELAGSHYGRTNLTTLDMLRATNPEIRDVDLIIAGSGLEFPDPGPSSRILADGSGYSVLALTTQTLSRALAVQSSLEDQLGRPVSLERVATRGGPSVFRVSIRGLSNRRDAAEIAGGLGPILKDPAP